MTTNASMSETTTEDLLKDARLIGDEIGGIYGVSIHELASRLEAAFTKERKLADELAWYQQEAVVRTTTGLRHGRKERSR